MFCTECGTKIEDENAKVCPNCGASLAEDAEPKEEEVIEMQAAPEIAAQAAEPAPAAAPQPEVTEAPQTAPQQMSEGNVPPMGNMPGAPKKEKKPLLKNKIFLGCMGGGLALLLIIIIAIVIAVQPDKIDVEKFVTVEYNGYDGYATANVYLDEYGLYEAIAEEKGENYSDLYSSWNNAVSLSTCIESIELTPDQTDKLANGDIVTVSITYDNDLAKQQKIKFVGESVSITVEGLEPVVEVDPFVDFNVSFTGISPNGNMEYEYTGSNEYVESYNFYADKYYALKNGETVTFTYDANDEYTLSCGYIITTKEKTYEVSGLEEYADSYSDLSENFINQVKSEAEDTIYAYVANNYSDSSSLSNLEYAGYILNCVKDASEYSSSYSNLYVIYKGDVSSSEGSFSTSKVYFPVRFKNVVVSGDNAYYESKEGILGYSYLDNTWYTTNGYVNPLTCYSDIVEANRDSYNAECGDGFEVYAEYDLISSLDDIGDDYKIELKEDAKDRVESYIASSYNSDSMKASNIEFVGEYLLLAKNQGTDFAQNNKYYIVYSATVKSPKDAFEKTTVYFPVAYGGLVALPGDEYMRTSTEGIKGSCYINDSWSYYTQGYTDGTKMFSDLVTAQRDNYTYEVSSGLEEFGK